MVRRIAADDHWLHDAAVARFEATLAAHEGGDFRREVAAQRDNAAALERRECHAHPPCRRTAAARGAVRSPRCSAGRANANPHVNPRIGAQLAACRLEA